MIILIYRRYQDLRFGEIYQIWYGKLWLLNLNLFGDDSWDHFVDSGGVFDLFDLFDLWGYVLGFQD